MVAQQHSLLCCDEDALRVIWASATRLMRNCSSCLYCPSLPLLLLQLTILLEGNAVLQGLLGALHQHTTYIVSLKLMFIMFIMFRAGLRITISLALADAEYHC